MTTTTATDYAEDLAERIELDTANGTPFGIREDNDGYGDAGEEFTAYDYLGDALDIEYRVSSDGTYRSAKVLIGYGGPNVWIDTYTCSLVVAWWSAPVSKDLPTQFIDQLDEALSELWSMR